MARLPLLYHVVLSQPLPHLSQSNQHLYKHHQPLASGLRKDTAMSHLPQLPCIRSVSDGEEFTSQLGVFCTNTTSVIKCTLMSGAVAGRRTTDPSLPSCLNASSRHQLYIIRRNTPFLFVTIFYTIPVQASAAFLFVFYVFPQKEAWQQIKHSDNNKQDPVVCRTTVHFVAIVEEIARTLRPVLVQRSTA